ncbi:hypothetical protein [Halobacillus seohaensis]|uniref:Uncharacterized protein n=1 Tax=Halobacillus seohaensis TaxID=447421 RepID=A0ABW2EHT0_9BACI
MLRAVTLVANKGHIAQHAAYGNALLYEGDLATKIDEPIGM